MKPRNISEEVAKVRNLSGTYYQELVKSNRALVRAARRHKQQQYIIHHFKKENEFLLAALQAALAEQTLVSRFWTWLTNKKKENNGQVLEASSVPEVRQQG